MMMDGLSCGTCFTASDSSLVMSFAFLSIDASASTDRVKPQAKPISSM